MNTDIATKVDRMLENGWYAPTTTARTATQVAIETLVRAGFAVPLVHATMAKGTQCEWESRTGTVIMCFDARGGCCLAVSRYGDANTDNIANPPIADVIAALRTL